MLSSRSRPARNCRQRFGLVHLAVAEEGPDLATLVFFQAAVLQVAHVARLVGGGQRAQPHRHGGELPELRHQSRVRIRGQAFATGFAAEVVHPCRIDAAFHVRAAVDPRRGVALDVDHVAVEGVGTATEEMIEAHVVQHCRRLVGGDVAADVGVLAGTQHHHHRVPADHRVQAALDGQVTRVGRLALGRDGVDVGGPGTGMQVAVLPGVQIAELVDQVVRARPAAGLHHRLQRFTPLLGFQWIGIEGNEGLVHGCLQRAPVGRLPGRQHRQGARHWSGVATAGAVTRRATVAATEKTSVGLPPRFGRRAGLGSLASKGWCRAPYHGPMRWARPLIRPGTAPAGTPG